MMKSLALHTKLLLSHPSMLPAFISGGEESAAQRHMEIALSRISSNPDRHYGCFRLYGLVRERKPDVVVETGVNWGGSSAFILKAMQENGKGTLYSIDLPNAGDGLNRYDLKGKETGFLIPQELRERWHLILGDSRKELPALLDRLPSVDLFHHDSLHTYDHMTFEYETVWPKLKEGGILASDDIDWNRAFLDFCRSRGLTPFSTGRWGYVFKPFSTDRWGWVGKPSSSPTDLAEKAAANVKKNPLWRLVCLILLGHKDVFEPDGSYPWGGFWRCKTCGTRIPETEWRHRL